MASSTPSREWVGDAMKHIRVARKLARDQAIPRWLRWMLLFGLLPIPGPLDDIVAVIAAGIIFIGYRGRLAHHYAQEALMYEVVPMDTWGGWA